MTRANNRETLEWELCGLLALSQISEEKLLGQSFRHLVRRS